MQFENNFVRFRIFGVKVPQSNDEDVKVESSINFEENQMKRFETEDPFGER